MRHYDVIVVGAGHAGCEAARAAARLGCHTLLVTHSLESIAQMSCNPAVGGVAKGQIVREIDALGGAMARITDAATIQFRMLNRSKGAAMWSPRAQCDRRYFSALWRRELMHTPGLDLWQDDVTELLLGPDNRVEGVVTSLGMRYGARAVVLTNGTFLNGLMHIGRTQFPGGRIAEQASYGLTTQLAGLGLRTARMKTGTPLRLDARTIDYTLTEEQPGDNTAEQFSYGPPPTHPLPRRSCHIVHTNAETHDILRAALSDSPLYNGTIRSIGPRYCPSIETKIVTFADRTSHQLFLEPEGIDTVEVYVNGFSSSLPIATQLDAILTIPALAHAHALRPGYAIEYDYFDAVQLEHTLQSRLLPGLYLAGQINGTTGYEEAAGQGLLAGINAARSVQGLEEVTLSRDSAYIGVLVDDLVTRGVDEPYRMFTSRAEYRITLRQDNADARLTPLGREIGLVDDDAWQRFTEKQRQISELTEMLATAVKPVDVNPLLECRNSSPVRQATPLRQLLTRPNIAIADLLPYLPGGEWSADVLLSVETATKYAGYLEREYEAAERMRRLEEVTLRGKLRYADIHALSTEARQKLTAHDPRTLGEAQRIPGVSPADINTLLLLLGR